MELKYIAYILSTINGAMIGFLMPFPYSVASGIITIVVACLIVEYDKRVVLKQE